VGLSNVVVPFVACGDLSGFDADKSYPLKLMPDASDYVYVQPVQPPIHPNYETFKHMQQQRTNPDSEV
jgi:tRNA (cytidine32/guanosine34-2'-O)-methyltransferase